QQEAAAVVSQGAPGEPQRATRQAYMRYIGQGHEIAVRLPEGDCHAGSAAEYQQAFEAAYDRLYGRHMPEVGIEILSWTLTVMAERLHEQEPSGRDNLDAARAPSEASTISDPAHAAPPASSRQDLYDSATGQSTPAP